MASYKLADLRRALMNYKKEKKYKGSPSKMKKTEIVEALKSLGFNFDSLRNTAPLEYDKATSSYQRVKGPPALVFDKATGVYKKRTSTKKDMGSNPLTYDKASGVYKKRNPRKKATGSNPLTYDKASGVYKKAI